MNQWLREHEMPPITVVEKMDASGNRLTLETECLRSGTLPSIAYGFKRCSQKHRSDRRRSSATTTRCAVTFGRRANGSRGSLLRRRERERYETFQKVHEADKKYKNRYPLIEDWHWTRDDCIRVIQEEGLPLPANRPAFSAPA